MKLVVGTSQIGRVVAEVIATQEGNRSVRLVSEKPGQEIVDGYPVLGSLTDLASILATLANQRVQAVVALESPILAAEVVHQLSEAGVSFLDVQDMTAWVSVKAIKGFGVSILPHATVYPGAVIGRHAVIGIGAVVGCDARVADFARIPNGAHIPAGAIVSAE